MTQIQDVLGINQVPQSGLIKNQLIPAIKEEPADNHLYDKIEQVEEAEVKNLRN
jgi:hypothetical protein